MNNNNNNREDNLKLMRCICAQHGVTLKFLTDADKGWDYNVSYCCPGEILLPPFTGDNAVERELISFFHELGHILFDHRLPAPGYSKMQSELEITRVALMFADANYHVTFSDDAIAWLVQQGLTYRNWEAREVRS